MIADSNPAGNVTSTCNSCRSCRPISYKPLGLRDNCRGCGTNSDRVGEESTDDLGFAYGLDGEGSKEGIEDAERPLVLRCL